jgi:hypothetical protein
MNERKGDRKGQPGTPGCPVCGFDGPCAGCYERDQRIGSLQARLDVISDTVKEWRAHFDSRGRGGQTTGDTHPYIPLYYLKELERLIGEEQGKYTYEYYLGMSAEITRLRGALQEIAEYNHTGMQATVAREALEK